MRRDVVIGCSFLFALAVPILVAVSSGGPAGDNGPAGDTNAQASPASDDVVASGAAPSAASALRVSVVRAGSVPGPRRVRPFRGIVRPRLDSPLSLRRGGVLAIVHVREGDRVSQGDVLAELEIADLRAREKELIAAVEAAAAEYDRAVAGPRKQTVAAAQAQWDQLVSLERSADLRAKRQQDLMRRGAGDQQTLDDTRLAAAAAKAASAQAEETLSELREGTRREDVAAAAARLAGAKAALESNRVDQRDSRIHAPFEGVVRGRLLDPGAYIAPGTAVLQLQAAPPLEARFGLPPEVARAISVGDAVNVRWNQATTACRVVRVHPAIDAATRTRAVDVEFPSMADSPTAGPNIGELVTLQWEGQANDPPDGFWLPTTALVRGGRGLWSVYVVQPDDLKQTRTELKQTRTELKPTGTELKPTGTELKPTGTVVRRNVRVLQTAGSQCQVGGSIDRGEWVIDTGVHRVAPNARVQGVVNNAMEMNASDPQVDR
ncbi:MAG: efflux RND transporter periplasmic adaptor subunit [Planctomycetota bacterium]